MKNVASLKTYNNNSPKTPGGISKSLLTPCRRLGLSRNWRKSGPSPFISPLSSSSQVDKQEKTETRKRKQLVADENVDETSNTVIDDEKEVNTEKIDKTPSRNVELPCRKKSKTLISTINKSEDIIAASSEVPVENCTKQQNVKDAQSKDINDSICTDTVAIPARTKSKNNIKRVSPLKTTYKDNKTVSENKCKDSIKNDIVSKEDSEICKVSSPAIDKECNEEEAVYTVKEKSPNDLRKECVVVIQRKIFKNVLKNVNSNSEAPKNSIEKPLTHDSESDDEPLVNLHKQNSTKSKTISIKDDDDDFINTKPKSKQIVVKETKSPRDKLKTSKSKTKVKPEKVITEANIPQNSLDDDEDDDFDNKKTIIIRKCYDKISKPIKAKSTGSITQRDIDNLRERIEAKKKLLLAQSITPETEELRTLIKKWQKGCQDALMELLDLMKNKCPDNDRMDYSEMLNALKIPASLVGYDSENDCFNSPDDASIILGQLKDI